MDSFDVVIAAGAFTTSDNLDYLPLQDLLKYVADTQPQFLILVRFLIIFSFFKPFVFFVYKGTLF